MAVVYNSAKKKFMDGGYNLPTDTIKVILLASTYSPNIDTDDNYDDIIAHELATANGYTAGGVTLAGKTTTVDTVNDRAIFDATDSVWTITGAGISFRYAVIYKSTGVTSTSALIRYRDFGSVITAAAGTLTFTWASGGIITNS